MEEDDSDPTTCELCRAPAVKRYVHPGWSAWVCARCADQCVARDAYEDELPRIWNLHLERRYDEELTILDAIYQANKHLDHNLWMTRGVAEHRADILRDARRFAEAEVAYRHSMALGFEDVSIRWLNAVGLAHTLDALGRTKEGAAVLEEALSHQERRFLPSAIGYLEDLVLLSNKIGRPVDARWLKLAAEVAELYGVALPPGDTPGEIILSLNYFLHPERKSLGDDDEDQEDEANDPSPPDTSGA
jgi:Tetratrico peptide repeat